MPGPPLAHWRRHLSWWLGVIAIVLSALWVVYHARSSVAAADAMDRNFAEGTARPADYRCGAIYLEVDT